MKVFFKAVFLLMLINTLAACGGSESSFNETDSLLDTTAYSSSVGEVSTDEVFVDEDSMSDLTDEEILISVFEKVEQKISELEALEIEDDQDVKKVDHHLAKLNEFLLDLESDTQLQDQVLDRIREGKPFLKKRRGPRGFEESDIAHDNSDEVSDGAPHMRRRPPKNGEQKPSFFDMDLDELCAKVESKLVESSEVDSYRFFTLRMTPYLEKDLNSILS